MVHEYILKAVREVAESEKLSYSVSFVKDIHGYKEEPSSDINVLYTIDLVNEPKAFPSPVVAPRLSFHIYVKEDGSSEGRWNAIRIALRLFDGIVRNFRIYSIGDATSCVYNGNCFFSYFSFTFREDDQ
jgi:hypothetical protein